MSRYPTNEGFEWVAVWHWIYIHDHQLGWFRHFDHSFLCFLRFVREEGL
jgi:hypothetical protein